MIILLIILQWFFILILLAVLVILCVWMVTAIKSKVPFVPVPNSILPYIHKALGLDEKSVLYDLGSGDGRILFYSQRQMPKARYIGIENGAFPLILSRTIAWWNKLKGLGKKAQILNKDFFKHDLSDATHIFVYLYPNVMDDLLPKFDKELKKGTRLVSVSFKFTTKQPTTEIDLQRSGKYQLARKLYVYEF